MKSLLTLILLAIGAIAFGQSNYYAKQVKYANSARDKARDQIRYARDAMDKAK